MKDLERLIRFLVTRGQKNESLFFVRATYDETKEIFNYDGVSVYVPLGGYKYIDIIGLTPEEQSIIMQVVREIPENLHVLREPGIYYFVYKHKIVSKNKSFEVAYEEAKRMIANEEEGENITSIGRRWWL